MTSATEKLRRLLDERGVKWKDYGYENDTWWGELHAETEESAKGLFLKLDGIVTPEQAIAATLGGANVDDALALLDEMNEQGRIEYSDYSRLHDAIAATLGGVGSEVRVGSLTVEQVREAAHGHYKLRMVRDVDGFDVPQVVFDWHAIADELNAATRNQEEGA